MPSCLLLEDNELKGAGRGVITRAENENTVLVYLCSEQTTNVKGNLLIEVLEIFFCSVSNQSSSADESSSR